jgi:sulfur carrier protein ThiS
LFVFFVCFLLFQVMAQAEAAEKLRVFHENALATQREQWELQTKSAASDHTAALSALLAQLTAVQQEFAASANASALAADDHSRTMANMNQQVHRTYGCAYCV